MRTLEQQLSYEHLELIPHSESRKTHSIGTFIKSIGTHIANGIARVFIESHEPHIWMKPNSQGHPIWYVRDSKTKHVSRFSSKQDVMVWLDERFYL